MKKYLLAITALLLLSATVFAQNGGVLGVVLRPDRTGAREAIVTLAGIDGPHHGGHHDIYIAHADSNGQFAFRAVHEGPYTITAIVMMRGFASAQIEVVEDQITNVTLNLMIPDSSNGFNGGPLTPVNLEGDVIVEADSVMHRAVIRYGLDINGDGTVDDRLEFGPPWYNPPSSAVRPTNGQHITLEGGLFSYGDPPMVIVYQLNGLPWRDPEHGGHGGDGGGDHRRGGCTPDSIVRVELQGEALLFRCEGFHGDDSYMLDVNADANGDFYLDFGARDYNPGNGATRPHDHEMVSSIVGGMVYCQNERVCDGPVSSPRVVIVYEINGMLWREPGDTVGLGPEITTSVGEPVGIGAPETYLTAHNYPNPFNPTTTISYSIPRAGDVRISIFDITGREVASLVNDYQTAGSYAVAWDGSRNASGIYFYRVNVGNLSFTNRMVLMK